MSDITLHFDGSCEPYNPGGRIGYGFVVKDRASGTVIHSDFGGVDFHPDNSNNVAEYMALCFALKWLRQNGHAKNKIRVYGDSMLVVNQMNGDWSIKEGRYKKTAIECTKEIKAFSDISFKWIRREENAEADELSKKHHNENANA